MNQASARELLDKAIDSLGLCDGYLRRKRRGGKWWPGKRRGGKWWPAIRIGHLSRLGAGSARGVATAHRIRSRC